MNDISQPKVNEKRGLPDSGFRIQNSEEKKIPIFPPFAKGDEKMNSPLL
jgi:hypothetical protein